jgi:hypothetical protein
MCVFYVRILCAPYVRRVCVHTCVGVWVYVGVLAYEVCRSGNHTCVRVRIHPHICLHLPAARRHGMAHYGSTWHSMARHGTLRLSITWHGMAWHGTLRLNMAWHGTAHYGSTRHVNAQHNMTQHGMAWHGTTHDTTWHNMAQHGTTWHNMAPHGMITGPSACTTSSSLLGSSAV